MLKGTDREPLFKIVRSFYETHHVTGVVALSFGERRMTDSDLQTVVDVYVVPKNEAAEVRMTTPNSYHIQLLEEMVPSELEAYTYTLRIGENPANRAEPQVEVLEERLTRPVI